MAPPIFSFVFLACLLGVWTARLNIQQVEDVPWKKAAALGTLVLGSKLSRHSVGAIPDTKLRLSGDFDLDPGSDVFDRAENALLSFIHNHQSKDGTYQLKDKSVVKRLIDDLRRSKSVDHTLVEMVDAGLRGKLGNLPEVHGVRHPVTNKPTIQQIVFPQGQGKRGIVIGRYLSHFREVDRSHGLQDMLRNMKLTNSHDDDLFLRCIAQSHTAEELAKDSNTEVMVMLEPFSGTMSEYFKANVVGHPDRMSLFLDAVARVGQLDRLGIPHKSDISQNTVLVKGDVSEPDSFTVVLSPNILSNGLTDIADDSVASDVQQLGSLLRWMYNSSTWPARERPAVDVILAFGRAVESGAVDSVPVLVRETVQMMETVFSERSTVGDMRKLRLEYLTLAVEAIQAPGAEAERAGAEQP